MAHHESCLLVDCSRWEQNFKSMMVHLVEHDDTIPIKPSEIPAVILSHVVVSYWSHFLDPWMSYCLLQTLLLGAVLFFFLSWWINWCWQRSHYNWNLVNPVLVIPLLCMYDFWCFVDRFSCFSLKIQQIEWLWQHLSWLYDQAMTDHCYR